MTKLTPETLAELRRISTMEFDRDIGRKSTRMMHAALPLLLDIADERDRLAAQCETIAKMHATALDCVRREANRANRLAERVRELEVEITAIRDTIAAGEPFDADEIEAMQLAGMKGELAAIKAENERLRKRLEDTLNRHGESIVLRRQIDRLLETASQPCPKCNEVGK